MRADGIRSQKPVGAGSFAVQIQSPRLNATPQEDEGVPAYGPNSADLISHAEARNPTVAPVEKPLSRKQADGRLA